MLHLPRRGREWLLFGVFLLGGPWTIFYESYIVLSHYHQDWTSDVVKFQFLLGSFLCLSIYTNLYLIITTDVAVKQINTPDGPPPSGWKYCEKCKLNAPPRSHHCKICNTCILKRDHHCMFLGYCIGFQNHRYFFCLALYTCFAGVYANIYNWEFFMDVKGGFAWTTVPSLLAPHVGLVFGYNTFYEFAITTVTSSGVFFTILFIWLIYSQIMQLANGQVMHERKKNITDYNLGLANSMSEVFGSAGLLVLLCPLVPTKLPGDGTSFPRRDDKLK